VDTTGDNALAIFAIVAKVVEAAVKI